MEIIIQPTPEAGGIIAARTIAKLVRTKPDCVLGLATGSTPLATYRELVRMHHDEGLDFSRVTTFNLDEYVGLPHEHSHSYHAFMDEHFFGHVNVPRARIHIPDGMARDVPAECARYEVAIAAAGGIDLQLLGIGTDGHIGFNEPSSSLASRTRIKTLTERTRADNARFFGGGHRIGLSRTKGEHEHFARSHDRPDAHRDAVKRHLREVAAEEPRIVRARALGERLDARARRER